MHKNCATKLSFNSGHLFVCVCKWHWSPMDRSDLPLQMVIIENRSPPRVSLLNERCSLGSATGGVLKNTVYFVHCVPGSELCTATFCESSSARRSDNGEMPRELCAPFTCWWRRGVTFNWGNHCARKYKPGENLVEIRSIIDVSDLLPD